MPKDNFKRMQELAKEFFAMDNDPSQISVNEETIDLLRKIHPNTLSEERNEDGPIAWLLIIPTTEQIMQNFISGELSERGILSETPQNEKYDAIYLCSILILPEFRGKGIAKELIIKAINSIRKNHPIQSLFYWAFSVEGEALAYKIASKLGLPIFKRKI
ncbi:MAG: GNAT family N-acetyltransferase [Ignavibacteriales bacterium]|nr:GNAT family N-acetyltransferase [Ignavibacteriales bacterium]